MSEENKNAEVQPEIVEQEQVQEEQPEVVDAPANEEVEEIPEEEAKPEEIQIELDGQTAFQMQLQEFDVKIAQAEANVAELKKQKVEYLYNFNVQNLAAAHQEKMIKAQIEEEARKRAAAQQPN